MLLSIPCSTLGHSGLKVALGTVHTPPHPTEGQGQIGGTREGETRGTEGGRNEPWLREKLTTTGRTGKAEASD